mmetsp:Transcript_88343/g.224883  ORF Transcript_88343/g.224883 Transcript_88343/m.224883 type:complete len:569 (+) Transcript_88343:115-1821(+)
MVKKFADIAKGKCKFGRRNMRNAMVMEMRRQEQLKRGTKVSGKGKQVTVAAQEVPITQRAGHPLVKTKAKPAEWKTIPGKAITVDLARVPWLPDDWGQGVKMTNPISRSTPGQGGTYTVWVAPCGRVFYHRAAMEVFLGRTLSVKDGFNGQRRLAQLQGKRTDEKKFFEILTPAERKRLPKADELHFCIVSARRTETAEGLQGIAQVQALFQSAAVEPTWYVDEPSLEEYKKLGLKAVVGGKLCPARNKCLVDAARLGKACVEVSDDISRWEYYDGAQAKDGSDDAVNAAHAAATCHIITPVAAARFLLAKLRAAQALAPDKSKAPHLAGVYPLGSCSRAFGGPEIQNQHFILGDFFVVDVGSKLRFDEEMTLKEDYDFTAQHIFTHGSVIRCTRMTIAAKHQTNAGGACAIRDKKGLEEQKNIAILMRKWPRGIRNHTKRKNEVMMQWPADGDVMGTARAAAAAEKEASKKVGGGLVKKDGKLKAKLKPLKAKSSKVPVEFKTTARVAKGGNACKLPYISARVAAASGKTVQYLLEEFFFKDGKGAQKKYGPADLRYDIQRGTLRLR